MHSIVVFWVTKMQKVVVTIKNNEEQSNTHKFNNISFISTKTQNPSTGSHSLILCRAKTNSKQS